MRRLALLIGLTLGLMAVSVGTAAAQPTGDWAVDDMAKGSGQTLSLRSNGIYEYKIYQILPGTRRLVQAEDGRI